MRQFSKLLLGSGQRWGTKKQARTGGSSLLTALVSVSSAAFLFSPNVEAQTSSWATGSGAWSDPGAWAPLGIPDSTTGEAFFPTPFAALGVDLDGGVRTVNRLDFEGSALDGAHYVIFNGTLVMGGVNPAITFGPGSDAGIFAAELASSTVLRLNSATLFDGTSADAYMTIGGTISGSGGLTKSGAGLLGLTGANSYTSDTTMNGGTLSVVSDPSLGASSGALIFNGGTLQNTGSFSSARSVVLGTGGGTLQTNADLTLSGDISGSGGIEKTGAGTLILSGDNSYLGATTIQNGVLAAEGGLATPDKSAVTVGSSGTYRVTDSEVIGSLAGTGSVIIGSGATLITGFNDQSSIFAGSFSGAGSLEIDGAGTFTVTGNNSLGGDITICCSKSRCSGELRHWRRRTRIRWEPRYFERRSPQCRNGRRGT